MFAVELWRIERQTLAAIFGSSEAVSSLVACVVLRRVFIPHFYADLSAKNTGKWSTIYPVGPTESNSSVCLCGPIGNHKF